jgi:tyrosinase
VWDPVTGFGGNGNQTSTTWGTNCVLDGPFVDLRLRYWNADVRPHCLLRVFEPGAPEFGTIPLLGHLYTPAVMARVNAETTYEGFSRELENGPHGAVHQGVGSFTGDVGPQRSSPNGEIVVITAS